MGVAFGLRRKRKNNQYQNNTLQKISFFAQLVSQSDRFLPKSVTIPTDFTFLKIPKTSPPT
jgi:hypothetical protein